MMRRARFRVLRWLVSYHVHREDGLIYFRLGDSGLRVLRTEAELNEARRKADKALAVLRDMEQRG